MASCLGYLVGVQSTQLNLLFGPLLNNIIVLLFVLLLWVLLKRLSQLDLIEGEVDEGLL